MSASNSTNESRVPRRGPESIPPRNAIAASIAARRHGCHADGVPRGDLQRHPSFLRVQSLGKLPAWSYARAECGLFSSGRTHRTGHLLGGDPRSSTVTQFGRSALRSGACTASPSARNGFLLDRRTTTTISYLYLSIPRRNRQNARPDRRRNIRRNTSHDDGPYPTAVSLR